MGRFKYTRYRPSPLDGLDLADLIDQLKDLFLDSGFESQFSPWDEHPQSHRSLIQALAEILMDEPSLPEEWRDELGDFVEDPAIELSPPVRQLLHDLIQKLVEQGFLRQAGAPETGPLDAEQGEAADPTTNVSYELSDQAADFLGYRTLQDLLRAEGKSRFGQHETQQLATGVAADAVSKPFEFGDTLNLDISETLLNAFRRGLKLPLDLDYGDLVVRQTDDECACATVVMLDCSHSMILYGEDRFTPAKKVALALTHLIRTRYPADSIDFVLFHDSAEEIPFSRLASVKVGPYHTNTCEGLKLARRILRHRRKQMRQILMITDGKPSAMTLPGGRIYKNPFGLDPMIIRETFRQVQQCRRSGIAINTFMVAEDYYLVEFVRRVAQLSRGRAYFASPVNLASYILMDFVSGKGKRVH